MPRPEHSSSPLICCKRLTTIQFPRRAWRGRTGLEGLMGSFRRSCFRFEVVTNGFHVCCHADDTKYA